MNPFPLLALLALLPLGLASGAIFLVAKVFAPRAAPNKIAAFIIAVSIAFIMSAAIAFIGGRYSPRAPSTLSFVATWLGCSLLISFVTVRYILRLSAIGPLALVCASIMGAFVLALAFQIFILLVCLGDPEMHDCFTPFWQS